MGGKAEKIDSQLIIIEAGDEFVCFTILFDNFHNENKVVFFFKDIMCVLNMPCGFQILGLFVFLRICWFW